MMVKVEKIYPTCQFCGVWFKTRRAALWHMKTHPGHRVKGL